MGKISHTSPSTHCKGNWDSHLTQRTSDPQKVSTPNRMSIRSATFTQCKHMTDRLRCGLTIHTVVNEATVHPLQCVSITVECAISDCHEADRDDETDESH